MRWATRARVHVDRTATAWLITRFIDSDAEFVFVDDRADVPVDATPFDLRGVPLSHHGGRCTFETALLQYELDADPVLEEIARIVHEADLHDDQYDAPAAPGLDAVIRGLSLTSPSDQETLTVTDAIFDGLYEHIRHQLLAERRG